MGEWTRDNVEGTRKLTIKDQVQRVYTAVVRADAELGGWEASVVCEGKIIHISEHFSRHEAIGGAEDAIDRAMKLRNGP